MLNKKKIFLYTITAGFIYGIFNYISGKINLPGCAFIELRPQVALPMFIGAYLGPLPGFITGLIGDRIGYAFQGLNIYYAWNWSIGNGFIGMFPGVLKWFKIKEIKSIQDYSILLILIVSASFFPIVFASVIDIIVKNLGFIKIIYTLILPAFITDAVFGLIIVPLMLMTVNRIRFTIGIRNMLMVTYLLLFSVLTTYSVSAISMWNNTGQKAFMYNDIYNIGILSLIILLTGLSISVIIVKKIISPVMYLTKSAKEIAEGNYNNISYSNIKINPSDELSCLTATFNKMANEIYMREEQLKKEVRELKIEIDKNKQNTEVSKIVDTDYFRDLKNKVKVLRGKND
ncbi:hypothetical protein KA977_08160 [Candidatus Dependentiae bacterium]|nr:hypothetical protein [Candidatus Dependentiae bacterium]